MTHGGAGTPTERQRRAVMLVVGLSVLALASVILRIWLFRSGLQYGAAAERAWNLILAAVVGLTVLAGFQASAVRRSPGGPIEIGSVVSAASAALAFATAAVGAVSLVAPNTPTQAAAPACSGTPVYGAKFFAQTVGELGGANARTGPSTAYPQGSGKVAVCTKCPNMPVAGTWLPAWTNTVAWRQATTWGRRTNGERIAAPHRPWHSLPDSS
jgi:hypothetical protein